ncbi:hypothetical protein R455_003945 [Salmonella enterica subsp. enterica]|uniref:hypothetical protein n=1 Tax=Salmonella enterica TaxID=28901 RepID=UPI0012812EE0|nr:hypothetical protein [Salmonella enterica]ECH8734029.1 hypothetical protein [Salmonella enterica subsp. enterica serovar Wandsworth]EDT6629464.1 hypothetical protein [Salmonella enterica subsp. enterica serovar Wandsworth]EDT6698797.1 hypothetical protein [Salmonella enterica subsp. enterica serovar Wandsworth]EDT6702847.1 hypothetical protein [Salmonella enterica subsp. enterica serovar Wandsworth]EDT6712526.1 hypothetical protein [Salmonella enterica subsp. enterica serovar Wandsworth]
MINPNKSLTQKALAGVQFLRMHAQAMADDDDFFIAIMSDPHAVAATAIEQLVKENTELRAQLVAFQKAANPAVAFDLAGGSDSTAWYTPFVRGAHVCLKSHPDQHGTVVDSFIHSRAGLRCHVCFDDECNRSRWVNAKNLELVPDK